ncbi:MAG: restriction endonuclease [Treponema sp.]|jgi:hypothetical protein|nr:restriction endonuclease [Treponema sp.]
MKEVTYSEAGLTKEKVYNLIFAEMFKNLNGLETKEIYNIVNNELKLKSQILSEQGKASLRRLINENAVTEGYVFPYDGDNPNWRLTNAGKELIQNQGKEKEFVYNTETKEEELEITNTIKGALLEKYVLNLLKIMHPFYSWFHQGVQKNNERGLDLIANKIGESHSEYTTIGVQIKNHKETSAPTEKEWLKFLAGCFVRHIDEVIFITTGKLNSEQRREAGEAKITVIEGIDELNRIAKLYEYQTYEEYIKESG